MKGEPCLVRGRPASDTLGEVSDAASEEAELDVLCVSPEGFRQSPQRGLCCRMTFPELAMYLSRPTLANSKDAAGAWSAARYRDGIRRKSALVHSCALVVDVDQGGDARAVAAALRQYRAVVHSTFSSSPEVPRCRIVLALSQVVDAATYERLHSIVRSHLRERGFLADEAAKDASRLSFAPCIRVGSPFEFLLNAGTPLDAKSVLAAHAAPGRRGARACPGGSVTYARAALANAAQVVARSGEGMRHATLNREAFAVARLADDVSIMRALLPAALHAGLSRAEAERTIRDAARARRGGR